MYGEWVSENACARAWCIASAAATATAADIASNKKFYACKIYVGYVQPVAV